MADQYLPLFANQKSFLDLLLYWFTAVSPIIAGALFIFGSPYGSQTTYSGLLAINGRVAWITMELISPLVFILSYLHPSDIGDTRSLTTHLFLAMWLIHYANRAIIYPLRQPFRKPMHVGIMLSACLFNTVNGYINGRWLATEYKNRSEDPLLAIGGICMFALGMAGNIYHDDLLMKLRRRTTGYSIPFGGLFGLVSCPHFLCELVEWTGYAVATGSPAAWVFTLNVACNLVPRAIFIHRWYLETFKDYPKNRKAVLPYLI